MAQPFDYTFKQQGDPFGSTMKGVETALGLANYAAKQKQALADAALKEQELKNVQDMQGELATLSKNPNATATDFTQIMIKYPSLSKDLEKSWGLLSAEQKNNEISYGSQVLFALEGNQPDMAKNLINERITALRNSGREDEAKKQEVLLGIVDTNPDAAKVSTNLSLVAALGPEKYQDLRTKIEDEKRSVEGEKRAAEEEKRKAEKQPLEVSKLNKEIEKAEQELIIKKEEAKNAPQKFKSELDKLEAELIIKKSEAKFAPEKFGAELKLTQSQIESARAARRASDAAAAKSGADAARARAEADQIAKGIIPADKRPEAERNIRKEYNDQTKVYQDVKAAYGRVKVSEDSAVGDLSLIFGYMKMLDPGSVVREGEFATAQNAAGVPERITNLYNRVISGERLNAGQRKSFKGQADKLFKSAAEQEKVVRDGLSRIAKGYGLNEQNIFYTDKEAPPSGTPGQRNVTVDY
jgi:hypothetical protein